MFCVQRDWTLETRLPNRINAGKFFKCGYGYGYGGIKWKIFVVLLGLGSSVVAIRECEAVRLVLSVVKGDVETLVGYSNGIVRPTRGIVDNALSIDGVEARVDAHVVSDNDQAVSLLVGHPYTEQLYVVITSMSDRLSIEKRRDTFAIGAVNESIKTVLRAVNFCEVPDNYVGRICVKTDFIDTELFVSGDIRESADLIPRYLVKTDEKGHLVGDKAERVLALVNEYKDIVAHNMAQLGCNNAVEMEIEREDGKTLYYRPYQLSYSEREQTKDLIKELKEADIVEECCSPYASSMLLVGKASGEIRMCEDFRALHKLTVKDH